MKDRPAIACPTSWSAGWAAGFAEGAALSYRLRCELERAKLEIQKLREQQQKEPKP